MSHATSFLTDAEHYAILTHKLDRTDAKAYALTRHGRTETGALGGEFVVYQMGAGGPDVLRRVVVDALASDRSGLYFTLLDKETDQTSVIGYGPSRLFDHPVFLTLPLHCKIHWRAQAGDVGDVGMLTWPIYIRTTSRRGLRESGVVYCEPVAAFDTEFGQTLGG